MSFLFWEVLSHLSTIHKQQHKKAAGQERSQICQNNFLQSTLQLLEVNTKPQNNTGS